MKEMGKMMGSAMGSAMPPMMEKMFATMSSSEQAAFVTAMMPKCVSMVLDSLDQSGRERLAREMIDGFTRVAEQYLVPKSAPDEGASRDESAHGGATGENECLRP